MQHQVVNNATFTRTTCTTNHNDMQNEETVEYNQQPITTNNYSIPRKDNEFDTYLTQYIVSELFTTPKKHNKSASGIYNNYQPGENLQTLTVQITTIPGKNNHLNNIK